MSANIAESFGSMVFNDLTMREKLPKDIYKALKKTIHDRKPLDPNIAGIIANAMKDWAVERGATHYTHWFQPMTGITAEKHDGFITPIDDGCAIMEFSGKELIKGEPDASSFPSGGLRATFEARGYTAWDPTSYAFIKDNTLCIPTVFCSYGGEALDKKTPLLRSMDALNTQALRILRLLGDNETRNVVASVGAEQEYFIIDKSYFDKRIDLIYCGRTLIGAPSPKGQELDDHYFGSINPKVKAFMQELDEELWKLGIFAKTEHNEVAPGQYELAPYFENANSATDHNQLTMETMKRIAEKHGLVCLLHEKPFAGVNGSGKHNNWSLLTDTGENLFKPGREPQNNLRFLVFLCAVIKAVDEYQDLLRISVATAGNDLRLGGNEAPTAIMSMFLGDELTEILDCIQSGSEYIGRNRDEIGVGAEALPTIKKDTTDRNRTSSFAFTGNKFEFRMLGSCLSISGPNIVLNTIAADALKEFADRLEKREDGIGIETAVRTLLADTIQKHRRIIFNGNAYSGEWVEEAERRGLSNYRTTPDCLSEFLSEKNVGLFERHNVFTSAELHSRCDILHDNYCKVIRIEARTLISMIRRYILPAVNSYTDELCRAMERISGCIRGVHGGARLALVSKLMDGYEKLYEYGEKLDSLVNGAENICDMSQRAAFYRDNLIKVMEDARSVSDELEQITAKSHWPFPTYSDMLNKF
ncbi:MAG: glutamine synthetase III [Christensenellaceae bacterium]|nr:glutamine synthetase III [Christensenellaceae bacterium]